MTGAKLNDTIKRSSPYGKFDQIKHHQTVIYAATAQSFLSDRLKFTKPGLKTRKIYYLIKN